MRTAFPLYERESSTRLGGVLAMSGRVLTAPAQFGRSPFAVIGDAVRDLLRTLEASAHRMGYRELEGYLADSGDVFELERRIRNVERRRGAGFDSYI